MRIVVLRGPSMPRPPGSLGSRRASAGHATAHEAAAEADARARTSGSPTTGDRLGTARSRPQVPLLFLARRQYLIALTDRRLLVFERRTGWPVGPPTSSSASATTSSRSRRCSRHRPLLQLRIRGANGSRLVLEFRPGHRALAAELATRLARAAPGGRRADAPRERRRGVERHGRGFWGDR